MKTNKKLIGIFLAVMMICGPLAMAQVYHTPTGSKTVNEPLDIEVWTNKEEGGSFGQGENLVVYFRANRDCYVAIYDLDTKGNINLLYPYDYQDENYIEGGVVYTIPDYYDDFVLRVNGPPGEEFIQAIAMDRDFAVPDWSYNFRDPDEWREIKDEQQALAYLEFINHKYFPVENCIMTCDMDYTFFEVRKNWQYSWDSYYYDDYSYYDSDVRVVHYYHPYYYRPVYYDPWWDPWDWCGTIYIGYPYGGAIWINGIFYGYAPLFIPRVSVGWCDVRIIHDGRDYYHDRVKIRRGISHELYHEGGYKWKTSTKADYSHNTLAKQYYPESKSISYKSAAKYAAGGKTGNVYKTGKTTGKYDNNATSGYKSTGTDGKSRDSYGTKTMTTTGKGTTTTKTDKQTASKTTTSTGKSTVTKGQSSTAKTKDTGSNKTTKSSDKSSKATSGGGSKSDKTKKLSTPSARFEQKDTRSSYGTTYDESSSTRTYQSGGTGTASSGYGKSGSDSRSHSSSTYDGSGSRSGSSSGSSSSYKGSSSSSSSSSGGSYSKGSSSSSSKSKGSSGSSSRSSSKSSGGSSKSSGSKAKK